MSEEIIRYTGKKKRRKCYKKEKMAQNKKTEVA